MRALIVEDDPGIAHLLREVLAARGYEVEAVADGALALGAAQDRRPDVILLDIGLPNVHGFGVLTELREDPALAEVPVVVISGWCTPALAAQAIEAGATAAIGKPFPIDELGEIVDAARTGPTPVG